MKSSRTARLFASGMTRVPSVIAVCAASGVAAGQDEQRDRLIDSGRPAVTAVYEFRNDRGIWPFELEDLTPEFLEETPSGWEYQWSAAHECTLRHELPAVGADRFGRRSDVIYVFGGDDQGWYAGPAPNYLPLNVAQAVPPTPNRSKEEWARRAAAEFDRRIAAAPHDYARHQAKVSHLYLADHRQAAAEACLAWAQAMPERLEVRRALIDVERKRRAGLDQWEHDNTWKEREYKSFGAWSIINNPFGSSERLDAVPRAMRLPFATDETEWLAAEYMFYGLAEYYLRIGDNRRAIQICDIWESAAGERDGRIDASYLAIRAGARLATGQLDAACEDLAGLRPFIEKGWVWADRLDELTSAVERGDAKFEYRIDARRFYQRWLAGCDE